MLDSGASVSLINPRFVKANSLPMVLRSKPLRLKTIDNTDVSSGLITHEVTLCMIIDDHVEDKTFLVADIGDDNIILGIDWLRHHNPPIDWEQFSVSFTSAHCVSTCLPTPTKKAARVWTTTGKPKCPPTRRALELEARERNAIKRATLEAAEIAGLPPPPPLLTVEERKRLELLSPPKPQLACHAKHLPSFIGCHTNSSTSPSPPSPSTSFAGLKAKKSSYTKFIHKTCVEAIRVVRATLDAHIAEEVKILEKTPGTSDGRVVGPPVTSGSVFLEQCWDARSEYSVHGRRSIVDEDEHPVPRVAAGTTVSQRLAEEEQAKHAGDPVKSVEELVPTEFHEFLDVFSQKRSERLPRHTKHDLAINLESDTLPKVGKLYQLSLDELRALKEFIDDNLAKGYIRPSHAPCGAPVFFVKKKLGGLCLVVDFRALNAITRPDSYPIPLSNELLDRLKAAKVFTTLDMRWGYYNVCIREGDEWKTSFRTRYGQFEFLVMQFGLQNAPAAFQRMVNDLFHDLVDISVVLYLDDIIIFSEDESKHDDQVREVLRRLREADLFLNPVKCEFRTQEVSYLGLKISPGHIGMDPVKVSGIMEWPTPQNVSDVFQFLGFTNFYRQFIPDYARITRPLERLKTKDCPWLWGDTEKTAFQSLKQAFVEAPLLIMPELNAPFRLETDASNFAMGAVLLQQSSDGDWRPVAYFSKAMREAERNYDVYDKELLAVVRALEEWRPYLEGNPHKIQIFSDHRNLEWFMTTRDLNRRQARWSLYLNRFNFVIEHRPGRYSDGPDALSRRPDH